MCFFAVSKGKNVTDGESENALLTAGDDNNRQRGRLVWVVIRWREKTTSGEDGNALLSAGDEKSGNRDERTPASQDS